MSKQIVFSKEAREQLLNGVKKLSDAVTATLGPNGRNVLINQGAQGIQSTKDGVTVAKSISLKDPIEDTGAQIVKQASIKTADMAGDGTTTSTLLAAAILERGMNAIESKGANAVEVKRGIEEAAKEVLAYIKEKSVDISDEKQLHQVATISANSDEEVGKLITSALDRVGHDGVVTVEESRTGETSLETVEGMQFDRGYKSPYFVTDNNTMTAVMNKPLILITEDRVTTAKQFLPILEACSQQSRGLVVIADDIDGEALSTLVVNKMRGILNAVAIKAPDFGDKKKASLEDIAILTGGTVVSKEKGMRLDKFDPSWLGEARKVTVTKEATTIIDGKGTEEALVDRLEELKAQIDASSSPYEKEQLQNRLGRLIGGIAIIHVGGHTEIEMKEKKDRVDDALHATKAAIEEGILPGGGIALYKAAMAINNGQSDTDNAMGHSILFNSIMEPLQTILKNAGYNADSLIQVMNMIDDEDNFWAGYDLSQSVVVDLMEQGIIDPAKVTRLALENAVSVAGTLILTECVMVEEESDNASPEMDMSQFM
jgi:chaperonin GroEL